MNFASRQLPIDGESNQRAIGDESASVADGVDPALPRELGPEIGVDTRLEPMIGVPCKLRMESSPAEAVILKPQFNARRQTFDELVK